MEKTKDAELEHRVIAKAVADLLTSLQTMERTDEILTNATLIAVKEDLTNVNCERSIFEGVFFHRWLVLVNGSLKEESLLRDEYAAKRLQATLDTSPEFRGEFLEPYYLFDNVEDYLCLYTVFREGYINRVFMKQAFNDRFRCQNTSDKNRKRHMLARAMVDLAESPIEGYERSLLNQIYRSALLEVALDISCELGNVWKAKRQAEDKLFETLKRLLEEETRLSTTLDGIIRRLELNDTLSENCD